MSLQTLFWMFQRNHFDFHATILGVVFRIVRIGGAIPADAFGAELVGVQIGIFVEQLLFHRSGPVVGQILHELRAYLALHAGIRVAFDHDVGTAVLASEFRYVLEDWVGVRLVEFLDRKSVV